MKFADVCVNISREELDKPFSYIIPEEMEDSLKPGSRVLVPFGRRKMDGYVLGIRDSVDYPAELLKPILEIRLAQEDSAQKLIDVAAFLRRRYGSTMIAALKTVLPIKKTYRRKSAAAADEFVPHEFVANREQREVIEDFWQDYSSGKRETSLLHGITGSGKTEVYIEIIRRVVALGKQCIVLIPEISLTYQTVARFKKYFGDRVGIMNSTLAWGTRYEYAEKAKKGELDVIIGPRSALFTPFPDIGLIVIDEEHEGSYKSESTPRYHAREVAEYIASLHGAALLLGSATPSVDSYYKAVNGSYKLYRLTQRAAGGVLPQSHIVDMREELSAGNRSIFSGALQEAMGERLEKGQQIMLFLNRRGYSGFLSCRACGNIIKCRHCDVSLSEHRIRKKLICHYCGYEENIPSRCPVCNSPYLAGFKVGTEQVENEVKRIFPQAITLRMDGDTTTTRDSYENILSAFQRGEANVLIGTQMIVKGHDYPNVTLVGILAADLSLAGGDYMSGERTFQLLTQAAGRAGRGDKPGDVFIQTYQPNHYSVIHAAAQDYESFYHEEIAYRELMGYPPAGHILSILLVGSDNRNTILMAEQLKQELEAENMEGSFVVFGPGAPAIGKIKDRYRYTLFVKGRVLEKIIRARERAELFWTNRSSDIDVYFDLDPVNPF